jgi:hypothetical protein
MPNSDTTYGVFNKQTREIKFHLHTVDRADSVISQSFSGNVETAKAAILTADALTNNDTNGTQLEYAITADGNGLKFTIAFGTKGAGTVEADDWADTWTTTKNALQAAKHFCIKDDFTSSTLSTDSTVARTCTITTTSTHGLSVGDIILLESVTLPGGTGLTDADFEGNLFDILTVPSDVTFTIDSLKTKDPASSVVGTGGSMTVITKHWISTASNDHLF